ncbi:hypothetical protein BDR22DRAFT_400482 [Usnea florida]
MHALMVRSLLSGNGPCYATSDRGPCSVPLSVSSLFGPLSPSMLSLADIHEALDYFSVAESRIIASVLQIAAIGLRLSIRLCTLGERVASADKSTMSISNDVSLISVLKELDQPRVPIELFAYPPHRRNKRPRPFSKNVWEYLKRWIRCL